MTWKFVVTQPDGTPIGELTAATARKIIWPLNDVANAAFTIDGQHSQAQLPVELLTDLLVYRDNELWFRGRMGSSQDAVGPSGESANMTAVDYRGLLGRRIGQDSASFTAQEQGSIAWDLVAATQATDGGALGILPGVGFGTTGIDRTIAFTDGSYVSDEINQMAALGDGFEWEIDQLLRLNVYYPQQGMDTATVLEYGGSVSSFSRIYDTTKFANAVRFAGSSTTTAVTVAAPELGSTPTPAPGTPGRMDLAASDSTIIDNTTLGLRADFELTQDDQPPVGYQMVLKSGWWTPEKCWKGDTVQLVLRSGRITEMSRQRVSQVEVDPGDDGGEVVTITTGPIPPAEGSDTLNQLRRLTRLELAQ